ncbi:hypothetical protein LEMLEM_LOCUS8509, partial [Lemmus lemmus]
RPRAPTLPIFLSIPAGSPHPSRADVAPWAHVVIRIPAISRGNTVRVRRAPEGPKGKQIDLPSPFQRTGRTHGVPGPGLAFASQSCSGVVFAAVV